VSLAGSTSFGLFALSEIFAMLADDKKGRCALAYVRIVPRGRREDAALVSRDPKSGCSLVIHGARTSQQALPTEKPH
jgi:hypothetical protein